MQSMVRRMIRWSRVTIMNLHMPTGPHSSATVRVLFTRVLSADSPEKHRSSRIVLPTTFDRV
jgi:hypothetical protein